MTCPPSSSRRAVIAALAVLPFTARPAAAQGQRPLEWVVGYPAGGGSDVVARTVAEAMAARLAQPVVVVNKPGAATNIAAAYVASAKDATHTLLTADFATLAANPALFAKLPYDAAKDFAPVGLLARFPMLLVVNADLPATTFAEFVAWARTHPERALYASAGAGSPHHLAAELLRERTGLRFGHVPYRGAAPAVQDLMGGQVPFALMDTAAAQPGLANRRLRPLAVASPARLPRLPDVPTLAELGLAGFEAYAWQGLVVPAAAPPEHVARLNQALVAALQSGPVTAKFEALALEALPGSPDDMARYVASERARWGQLIRQNQIRLD